MTSVQRVFGAALVGLTCGAALLAAVDLAGLQTSQAELQARLSARSDCLAGYRFGAVPEGLTFEPAPEKDALSETAGSFAGQRATRIFHGKLKGPVLDIPATGFTLCCWLKVNKLEEVDRGGYKRTGGGVMACGSGYYNGWRLLVSPHDSGISFALGRPEGSTGISSSGFLTPGEWHHVAVTWDLKNLALWIDGVARAETTTSMSYNPATTLKVFRIGECDEGTGVLDFEIADLGFFSTALPGEAFEGLGNPDAVLARRLTEFLQQLPPPPDGVLFRGVQERRYRERFEPLLTLTGCENSPAFRDVRSYARLCVAESFLRSGTTDEAEKAFRQLAEDDTSMLQHRARAMLAQGDMPRDRKDYTTARREYEKTRDLFVAKHEAFRVEALARLRDIETLKDGEPFRSERQRRIDRIDHATPWFYASPDGDDGNPGTAARPFRTLERARDALRARRKTEPLPAGGVAIVLKGGVYPRLEKSFTLVTEDSGTADAPVVYRAAPGEKPILRAGQAITNFVPVIDSPAAQRIPEAVRSHVLQVDLRAAGITDFGALTPRGQDYFGKLAGVDVPAHLELFFDGVPMSLARWPNDTPKMSERFALVEVNDQDAVRQEGRVLVKNSDIFYYSNPRQDAWANESDPWLFGYWQYAFFSSYRKILRVDPEKNQIQIDWNLAPGSKDQPNVVKGSGYQGINLLCELDSPGEWYLDRGTGVVYFWPPSAVERAEVLVSMLEVPVIAVDAVSNVVLHGLTIEAGRQHGVVVKDGENVLLAGCTVRDMGCKGADIAGGRGHALVGCDLAYLGNAGVTLTGGDLPTLRSSEHVVENCHIHHFANWNRGAYQPGIGVKGVGVRMSNNLIHDAPHQAFLLCGNDHVTEYNEIHDVTHEAGDAGMWYMYGDVAALAERGNVVRYNYWHHQPHNETLGKYHCVCHMGVYIDNVNGGVTVYGNVFSRIDVDAGAVFFGGSDDIVENNVFHRCRSGINMEDRSWVYAKAYKGIDAYMAKMKVTEPPWSVRYPRLTTIKPQTEDLTLIVRGNVAARNIGMDCGKFIYGNATTMRYARIERNWEKGDPGFRDADGGDFELKPDAPVLATCLFEPLPFKAMGLYNDELRASWPVHHPSGNYETFYRDSSKIDKAERKPIDKMPVCRASPRTTEIAIDGKLDPAEWDGLDPAKGYALTRNPENGQTKARPSMMWLRRDAENLYIALSHELEPGQSAKPKGNSPSWWGDADIAEVIFEGEGGDWWPADKGHGPIFYLIGDCTGAFESYTIAGLPKPRADGLRGAVQYAAASAPGCWTAEWRVPLAALCLDPKEAKGCCFNVGVHKPQTQGDNWAVWVGAEGANWKVWNAGWLSLKD
ncbi:MAG: hypothetical protein A3K19_12145 [Lentisphaerae bacterium RIFOXYB12_FULL_65_16]|nr:MAG: hypothetical protein A3K18_14540 [Lentisphaerae bacterium RIFOXYA12_64_32]OGV86227.1 MAG: hypothetical protein A3K19_12145 [Lentisphaerae bacterium RIFOXYB12_FULL_65_16]